MPLQNARVKSDIRLKAAIPTLQAILDQGAAQIMVASHMGRPKEGMFDPAFSLQPVAQRLSELLHHPVELYSDWVTHPERLPQASDHIIMLENVRFNQGELENDTKLAQQIASLCDVFVMDAFAAVHRAHASTCGVARFAPIACAGPLLSRELEALAAALQDPTPPLLAIVGGAKVSSKLGALEYLISKIDQLVVGGGMANTFLAASGMPVGKSLYEQDLVTEAKRLLMHAEQHGAQIPLPTDVVVATEMSDTARATIKPTKEVQSNEMILDIGPKTVATYADIIARAGTVIWNGPVGVFECAPFAKGTMEVANAIAKSQAFSMAVVVIR